MFIVQGVIRLLHDPVAVRAGDEAYDALLHQTEGMYWNVYLERLDDPGLTIHTQAWKEQATSETFGISVGFQELRVRNPLGARTVLEGPLSPGYWRPVLDAEYRTPPTGYDPARLGFALHAIVFVRPGREADYLAAERAIAAELAAAESVYWFRVFHNLGRPNAYSRIIHWRDAAGSTVLGDTESARRTLVDQELGGMCRVKLFSDWPERRARDGV
ncbi:MAG: hypothetical protein U0556_10600 [Dehalococcoidia bacterium]